MGQLSTFRSLSPKAKAQFIWDYYRWHILAVALVLSAVTYTVDVKMNLETPILNLAVIRSGAQLKTEEIDFSDFLEKNGYDGSVYVNRALTLTGELGTSYQSMQILHSYSISGEIDVFLWGEDSINQYFEGGLTSDVFDILSENVALSEEVTVFYTNNSEDPYPCFIKIESNAWVQENLGFEKCYIAFSCNPLNPNAAKDFVNYILSFS